MTLTQYVTSYGSYLVGLGFVLLVFREFFISSLGIGSMKTELAEIKKILQENGLDHR